MAWDDKEDTALLGYIITYGYGAWSKIAEADQACVLWLFYLEGMICTDRVLLQVFNSKTERTKAVDAQRPRQKFMQVAANKIIAQVYQM